MVEGLPKLTQAYADGNKLVSVSFNNLLELQRLSLYDNSIESFDFDLPKLMFCFIHQNNINQLKLEKLPMLLNLDVSANLVTSIDMHANKIIRNLTAEYMPNLKEINLANGNYDEEAQYEIKTENPKLTTVYVDAGAEEEHIKNIFRNRSQVKVVVK